MGKKVTAKGPRSKGRPKRLPDSFVADYVGSGGAGQDLFPHRCAAIQLFAEISELLGFGEAELTFTQVVKQARKAATAPKGSKKAPPKKLKGQSHNPLADLEWLTVHELACRQGWSKRRIVDTIQKNFPRYPDQTRGSVEKTLRRLLFAQPKPGQIGSKKIKTPICQDK